MDVEFLVAFHLDVDRLSHILYHKIPTIALLYTNNILNTHVKKVHLTLPKRFRHFLYAFDRSLLFFIA